MKLTALDHEKLDQDIRRGLAMTPLERLQWLEEVQALVVLAHSTLDVPLRHDGLSVPEHLR